MRRAGVLEARPRPRYAPRPAWEANQNIRPRPRPPALPQLRYDERPGREMQAPPGPTQIEQTGQAILETTGLPSIRRSARAFASGDPGTGLAEGAMGALGLAGLATMGPARASVRSAAPMEVAPRLPVNPTRLPGRASDGTVLPVRPSQPFRQSMVGGSDDLREAARPAPVRPDAGGAGAGQWPRRTDAYHIVDVRGTDATRPGRYGPAVHFDLDPAITTHLGDFGSTRAARFDYRLNGRFASPEQFRQAAEAAGSAEAAQQALRRQGFIGVRDNEFVAVWDRNAIGRAKPMGPLPAMSTRRRAVSEQRPPDGGTAAEPPATGSGLAPREVLPWLGDDRWDDFVQRNAPARPPPRTPPRPPPPPRRTR